MSPLRRAINLGQPKKVRKILEEAGPTAPDLINEDYTSDCFFCCFRNSQNPLHTAMSFPTSCREIVHTLIEFGGDPNERDVNGRTCLHRAGRQNNLHFAELFINANADMYLQDGDGYNVFHSAVLSPNGIRNQNVSVLEYFISLGKPGDLESKDRQGGTPLHVAAACDNVAAVKVLLNAGADFNAVNNKGLKPKDLAKGETLRVFEEFERQQQ
jgi:ankyrin repeat protein